MLEGSLFCSVDKIILATNLTKICSYGLITEQKKGPYKYFVPVESDVIAQALNSGETDLSIDDGLALVAPNTQLVDEVGSALIIVSFQTCANQCL